MKKLPTLIALLFLSTLCFSQVEVKKINNTDFKFVTTTINDTILSNYVEIYRDDKKIITHTLSSSDGDCSSENIELGSYKTTDSEITCYSYWASADRMGQNIYPYGFRKQTYTVASNGSVKLSKTALYIKTFMDNWETHPGMKYLNTAYKTNQEKTLFEDYIDKTEKKYASKFVFGQTKDNLEKEVRKELKNDIFENTKNWKEIYTSNCNM